MRVGGLAVRWVLAQHAEPWFLTLQSKRAYSRPSCDEPKSQSSTRKRSRRDAPQETGRPAKRPAVDTGEEELRNEEGKDEGGKVMDLEEEPEDAGGRKKTDAVEEQEKVESGVRGDEEEAQSPTAALSGADDE